MRRDAAVAQVAERSHEGAVALPEHAAQQHAARRGEAARPAVRLKGVAPGGLLLGRRGGTRGGGWGVLLPLLLVMVVVMPSCAVIVGMRVSDR